MRKEQRCKKFIFDRKKGSKAKCRYPFHSYARSLVAGCGNGSQPGWVWRLLFALFFLFALLFFLQKFRMEFGVSSSAMVCKVKCGLPPFRLFFFFTWEAEVERKGSTILRCGQRKINSEKGELICRRYCEEDLHKFNCQTDDCFGRIESKIYLCFPVTKSVVQIRPPTLSSPFSFLSHSTIVPIIKYLTMLNNANTIPDYQLKPIQWHSTTGSPS